MPKRPDFDKLRAALHQLNLDQARQLYAELSTIVQALEQEAATPTPVEAKGQEVVETQRIGERLYQLERVRCGKTGCKCMGKDGSCTVPTGTPIGKTRASSRAAMSASTCGKLNERGVQEMNTTTAFDCFLMYKFLFLM